jgi:hypothetical protein
VLTDSGHYYKLMLLLPHPATISSASMNSTNTKTTITFKKETPGVQWDNVGTNLVLNRIVC